MLCIQQSVVIVVALLLNRFSNGDRTFMSYMENELNRKQTMMPNVRESLDDCHMRYYKHSLVESSYPVFQRPHQKMSDFPHLGRIGWTNTDGTVRWNCSGTLVWENFILTSARCTSDGNSMAPDVVRLGDSGKMQEIKIAEAVRHPEYREGIMQHDIALLRLQSKVELDSTVVPACLWNNEDLKFHVMDLYQKQVLIDQTDSLDVVTPARRRLEPRYTDAMVEIRYGGYSVSREDCYGLIIDEDTVLTLAQCTTNHGKRATFVMYMGNERNTVVKHYNHPGYREGQYYNNIGLLKVRSRFVFFGSFVPFCIWHESDLADSIVELTGHGRRDLNYFSLHNASVDVFEPQNFQLVARANVLPINKCSYPEEFSSNLSNGLTGEHLCFGNEAYLVPETCQQAAGGPIGGKKFKFNKQFRYAYALNSFGRDCGFGRAAVGVRLSSHIGWLQSVLLPDYRKDSGSVHFLHSELEENDTCRHVDDGTTDSYVYPTAMYNRDCEALEEGLSSNQLCVDVQPHDTKVSLGDLLFWSEVMDDGTQVQYLVGIMSHVTAGDHTVNVHSRISSYYKYGKTSMIKPAFGQPTYLREFAHMAAIGWTQPDGTITWNCGGSLIWENYILTAAHCVEDAQQNAPDVARFGDLDLFNATDDQYAQQLKIVEIIRHPEHRHRNRYHDIALMRLEREVV
uniref:Peptidase S1 domain-containing protein n=1 Tax=Anopheles merus TaxID=30066 RepID=A0A182VC52_ANOME